MVADNLRQNMHLQNVEILYNAIDMKSYEYTDAEKSELRKSLHYLDSDIIILGNGQIQPRKKFDVFLTLAQKFPHQKFIWVGGMPFKNLGAESGKMEKYLENLPKNLLVTGVIPLEEVRKFFIIADIFILPSLQENHPMAVLEAAGAGLPIILRDIPEYNDTFRGYVALAKDDADFPDVLQKMVDFPDYRAEMAKKSEYIRHRFSTENNTKLLVEFYEKILAGTANSKK